MTIPPFLFEVPETFPASFPRQLDPSEEDALSYQDYADGFKQAQEACIPYYAVVIVESNGMQQKGDENVSTTYYHVYDMAHFETYRNNCIKRDVVLNDPVSRVKIVKVYHFAIKCFEEDPSALFKPADSEDKSLCFKQFSPPRDPVLSSMLKDALNPNIQEMGSQADKQKMRREQFLLAQQILNNGILSEVASNKKSEESLLWLWCSAKGSKRSVVDLAKRCLQDPPFTVCREYPLKLLSDAASSWDANLPRMDREACAEAKRLLNQRNSLEASLNVTE